MYKSNIIAGSNICAFSGKRPEYDEGYVKQVHDIERLKYIKDIGYYDTSVPRLSEIQKERINTIDRCTFAKNDPCWGYSFSNESVVCACINGKCKHILKCNPDYSIEYAKDWLIDENEHLKYGNPEMLKRYYYVDLESDEEMRQYLSDPEYNGLVYTSKDREITNGVHRRTRIDPETGRLQIVVGHKWTMVGGYDTEVYDQIWACADDEISPKNNLLVKAPFIEPLEETLKEGQPKAKRRDADSKREILNRINGEVKTSDAAQLLETTDGVLIVCENVAERGFVSKMLTEYGIEHGYYESDKVQITSKDSKVSVEGKEIAVLTSGLVNNDNSDLSIWTSILAIEEVFILKTASREFRQISLSKTTVYACANNYGLTHICIAPEDLNCSKFEFDGIYEISLEYMFDRYAIMYGGDSIGYSSDRLMRTIIQLCDAGEIVGIPVRIEGIQICRRNGKSYITGIGHLVFLEY